MSLVADFIAALEAAPAVFKLVGGASDFAAVKEVPLVWPAAFVLIEGEEAEPNNRAVGGPVLQRLVSQVAVAIVTRNLAGTKGAAAAEDIETLKAAVRARLIGRVPASAAENGDPIEYVEGELLAAKAGIVWHREAFSAVTYIGGTP